MRLQAACLCLSMAVASAQNVMVEVGAKPVGARGKLNLESGNGVLQTCRAGGPINK